MDHLGHKEPGGKILMHVLRFTAFPEVCVEQIRAQQTMLIFSSKCLFNLDSLLS